MSMTHQRHLAQWRLGLMRRIGRRAGRYAEDTEGLALVEFAFMFPFLVMILMTIITLSHMMMIDRKVTITAQAAVDLIAQRQAMDDDDVNEVRLAAQLMMQPFTANFDISVAHVPFDETTGVPDMSDGAAWRAIINGADQLGDGEVEAMADGTNVSAPGGVTPGPMGTPGDALVMLRMNYRYQSILVGDFNILGIGIPAEITFTKFTYSRPRLSRQITASDPLMSSSP